MARMPLIVYSHLRWNFVYQRPQHVLTRLAQHRRVLFVEEPVEGAPEDGWERCDVGRNLSVYRPCFRGPVQGFEAAHRDRLAGMLETVLAEEGVGPHAAWLYTPLAFPVASALAPEVVIYDCMDELANFRFAPPEIGELEQALLRSADAVFTGGPSLFRAKRQLHPNVHCFPSSVDVEHFAKGRKGRPVAAEEAAVEGPKLGFFGVIDERMDLEIVDALALAHPDWQIFMIGPIVKIDPNGVPQRPNLHWLGSRPYEELPSHLAGWDVSIMPFALNDATRFISPTKTLEYMAAEHPIVSTPIRDVAGPYEDIVYLGEGPAGFVAACEQAFASTRAERTQRVERMRKVLAATSWDRTVQDMEQVLCEVECAFAHRGRSTELGGFGWLKPGEI